MVSVTACVFSPFYRSPSSFHIEYVHTESSFLLGIYCPPKRFLYCNSGFG